MEKNGLHLAELSSIELPQSNDTISTAQVLEAQLNQLRNELEEQRTEMATQQWMDRSLSRFDEVMRANFDKDLRTYTEAILLELGRLLNCVQAVLYTAHDGEEGLTLPHLNIAGGYACDITQMARKVYSWGEGLVGQCAKSRDAYVLNDLGEHVNGGLQTTLVEVPAQCLLILPIAYNEKVRGVIEVLLLKPLTDREREFLNKLCNNLGASLESLLNQERVREMFNRSNEAYQQLATQEEEMRQNMEELQATQEEMKRVQQVLQSQSELQKRTIENVPGVLYTFRLDLATNETSFTFVSKRIVELLGYQPHQLENVPMDKSPLKIYEEDLPEFEEKLAISAKELSKFLWESRILHANGSIVWLRVESSPYMAEDGKAILWDGIMMDISQRKEQERALQAQAETIAASEEEMRQNLEELQATQEDMKRVQLAIQQQAEAQERLIANVPGMVFTLKMDTQTGASLFTFISDQVKNVLGFEPEELVNVPVESSPLQVMEEDSTDFAGQLMVAVQEMRRFEWEGRIYHKDGKVRWIRSESTPYLVDGGKFIQMDGIMSDISERKTQEVLLREKSEEIAASEEELRQNLEELQATQEEMRRVQLTIAQQAETQERLISNVPGVVFTLRMDTQTGASIFSYLSNQVKPVLGFEPDELVNVPLENAALQVVEEDSTDFAGQLMAAVQQMKRFEWEGRIYHKDGKPRWIRSESTPYLVEDGKFIQMDGIMSDISERKAQEALIQEKSEAIAASEEELRQNLEELQATQEEMKRAQAQLLGVKKQQEKEIARLTALHQTQLEELNLRKKEAEDTLAEAQKRSAQIETQQKVMVTALERFKAKEAEYQARIDALEKSAAGGKSSKKS